MNYGELKASIRDLGFSDDAEIEEFGAVVPNAVNLALADIGQIIPFYEKHEFEIDSEDSGFIYIDMTATGDFVDFRDIPVLYEQGGKGMYSRFSDYEVEMGSTLVINADLYKGRFRVYYTKKHEELTEDTEDTTKIDIPAKAEHLLKLLTAYYVWIEDEPTKATQYYNLYEQRLADVMTERPRGKILRGGI